MDADRAYGWLMDSSESSVCDGFDIHVVASMLAVAIGQSEAEGVPFSHACGLDARSLRDFVAPLFPAAAAALASMAGEGVPSPGPEEKSIVDILLMYGAGRIEFLRPLAMLMARRAQEPHHLWQDLGLRNRGELSQLMTRHFPRLKNRNSGDMKWKKFLYRMVCGSEGFTLCPSPVCSDCHDYAVCFGSEEGVAQIAATHHDPAPRRS